MANAEVENVRVVVRLKPPSAEELLANVPQIVVVDGQNLILNPPSEGL